MTKDLVFIIHPSDIEKGDIDLDEVKDTFRILCASENLKRMVVGGDAKTVDL